MSPSKKQTSERLLLAADIGATNTRLALFAVGSDLRTPKRVTNFKGNDYSGLVEILHEFLGDKEDAVVGACFGAAGPVVDRHIQLTNLAWTIDADELKATFGWEGVWLLNDLQAIANSVPLLSGDELHTLRAGIPEPKGKIAVIGPGTGLGIGFLTWAGGRYHAYSTEGGHSDFAPSDALQDEMLSYLRRKFPQVAVEHVCSGIGLPNVYDFLKSSGKAAEPKWLADELSAAPDKTPVIVQNGIERKPGSELCQMTVKIFIDVLAAEAGNLALLFGATGGVFIGGGLPLYMLGEFDRYNFVTTFNVKTGYEYYLERFPIHIIRYSEPGLLGAAAYGMQHLQ
ncbi:MAG: glucokinase [Anaerolineales bacterium]